MKRKLVLPANLILLLALALARPVVAQPARSAPAARHALWKIEGRTNVVYLLGSIHVLKQENYPLAVPIEAAFSNAPMAVFEADLGQMESPETQFKLLSKAQLPDGETLQQQLSAETYARFSNRVSAAGLPLLMFDSLKPALAAVTIELLEMQKLGLDPQYGVDQYLYNRAKKEGKQIVPLETIDFQLGLITDFSKQEGELLMKTTLEEIDKTKQEFGDILTAWQTGNAEKLEKLLNQAEREAPAIFKRLVADRNRQWAPKIEEWLRGGKNAIVIVGAGHLVGADGVVELLKKKGLKVTQM